MKVREVLEKARFFGKRFNQPKWRFVWAVVAFWCQFPVVGVVAPRFGRSHAPLHQNALGILLHVSCTVFAIAVLIPVIRGGRQWQKWAALCILLSFGLIPILIATLLGL